VARSICSSKALLVDDPNQPAMMGGVGGDYAALLLGWGDAEE
jgi:hypothetical protein